MIETQPYEKNLLAQEVYGAIRRANFGSNFRVVPVTSPNIVEQLKASEIKYIDYRAKTEKEDGFAPVFDGLAFDSENVRSQAIALYEGDEPVGVMTQIIAPRKWVEKQRYFEIRENGIYVRNFEIVSKNGLPDFMIIPAWTKVTSKHSLHFAIPGFRAFQDAMSQIVKSAPENTWMEAIARGQFPSDRRNELLTIAERGVGTFVSKEELPFEISMIGKNDNGSSSSVKMARVMGLEQIQISGSAISLGPVFAKKLR